MPTTHPSRTAPVFEHCATCKLRSHALFCDLPQAALEYLQAVRITAEYPKGSVLCLEGQPSKGVYILCSGRAKLSTTSREGKSLIVRIAAPGEVFGLTAMLEDRPYEVTAETLERSTASFITRADFVALLQKFPAASSRIIAQLIHNYRSVYDEIRALALSPSIESRLAKLLVQWVGHNPADNEHVELKFTQEDIAEMIGTTRETVSRHLSEMKAHGLIELDGSTITVRNCAALKRLIA
jgi:CRP/FNR family transcriptional regulator